MLNLNLRIKTKTNEKLIKSSKNLYITQKKARKQ